MLRLWLAPEYRSESWSIYAHMEKLSKLFERVRLPSTTSRIPRSLSQYSNYKANELRILLLFGHVIFADFLPEVFYEHFLQLVCLLHLAENRRIRRDNISIMEKLGQNFVLQFSVLYTDRHCVQVVHSIVHITSTIRDFGPLTNYTTFNFEDQLGESSVTSYHEDYL